jgi:hypothetical protein
LPALFLQHAKGRADYSASTEKGKMMKKFVSPLSYGVENKEYYIYDAEHRALAKILNKNKVIAEIFVLAVNEAIKRAQQPPTTGKEG